MAFRSQAFENGILWCSCVHARCFSHFQFQMMRYGLIIAASTPWLRSLQNLIDSWCESLASKYTMLYRVVSSHVVSFHIMLFYFMVYHISYGISHHRRAGAYHYGMFCSHLLFGDLYAPPNETYTTVYDFLMLFSESEVQIPGQLDRQFGSLISSNVLDKESEKSWTKEPQPQYKPPTGASFSTWLQAVNGKNGKRFGQTADRHTRKLCVGVWVGIVPRS